MVSFDTYIAVPCERCQSGLQGYCVRWHSTSSNFFCFRVQSFWSVSCLLTIPKRLIACIILMQHIRHSNSNLYLSPRKQNLWDLQHNCWKYSLTNYLCAYFTAVWYRSFESGIFKQFMMVNLVKRLHFSLDFIQMGTWKHKITDHGGLYMKY